MYVMVNLFTNCGIMNERNVKILIVFKNSWICISDLTVI
jgi:hypothetical protein